MNEKKFEESLYECIEWSDYEDFEDCRIDSFEDCGILTQNKGLVIRLKTGDEFQLTIVKSKSGKFNQEDEE